MADLVINLAPGVPSYRQRTQLEGRVYVLVLRWSQREERWYLDVCSSSGTLLVGAIKVVANWPLLGPFHHLDTLPLGDLYALDARPEPADPGLDELGDVVPLVYREAA